MTPAEFATAVVAPTLQEFLAERGDRRRAYLACIAVYHLVDHVAHAAGDADNKCVWSRMKADAGLSFEAVHGIVNAIKHPRSNHAKRFPPGGETEYPIFSLDILGSGLDESRFEVEGLEVGVAGHCIFVDDCVQAVFRAFVIAYPQHLGSVDRSFLDEQFRIVRSP